MEPYKESVKCGLFNCEGMENGKVTENYLA
jgi:hypothetical protein